MNKIWNYNSDFHLESRAKQSVEKICGIADHIIPGHGGMFEKTQYRSLKFRAFLQPDLYCKSDKPWKERLAQWKGWLNAEKELIEKENLKELQDCVENDTVSQPPPDISR